MKAICYENTKTTLPGWVSNLHESQKYGYSYESDKHFIHIYGSDKGLYTISPGLTVCEKKIGLLNDWVQKVFGATHIQEMSNDVGCSIKSIWRPGLCYDDEILAALASDEYECRSSEQTLKILLEKLDELLIYIEPNTVSLNTYSHKTRELLILSCTEVENQWLSILKKSSITSGNGKYSTNDYVKLKDVAFLHEYKIVYKNYRELVPIKPFDGWNTANPTQSLSWYDSYNKTKHDRDTAFSEAKLIHVLNSIAANVILHCVRFGPYSIHNNLTTLSGYIHQMINITLENPDIKSFYIPLIELPIGSREDLFCYDSYKNRNNKIWTSQNLVR